MSSEKPSPVKIVIIVLCLAGAGFGLWYTFGRSPQSNTIEGGDQERSLQQQGVGDIPEEKVEEITGGA